jgi:hypothetical protein
MIIFLLYHKSKNTNKLFIDIILLKSFISGDNKTRKGSHETKGVKRKGSGDADTTLLFCSERVILR